MANDKEHAIGHAGSVPTNSDNECYDYYKDEVGLEL
jgi:hypothetical protein